MNIAEILLVYSLLTSACYYLGSRATLTRELWSRYPPKLAAFMDCAACTGFWYGLGWAILFQCRGTTSMSFAQEWYSSIIIGLCSIVTTPIVAGLMQAGFERLGSSVEDPEEPEDKL